MAKAALDKYVTDRRRKNEKRRVWRMTALLAGAIILSCAFIFRTLILSSALTITSVRAEGVRVLSSEEAIELATARTFRSKDWFQSLATPRNVLAWHSGDLEGEPVLPLVRRLSLERNVLKRSLTVKVEEREPYGIWCLGDTSKDEQGNEQIDTNNAANIDAEVDVNPANFSNPSVREDLGVNARESVMGRCWWFDSEGVLFRQAPAAEGGTIRVVRDESGRSLTIGARVLPASLLANLSSVFTSLVEAGVPLGEVRLTDLELQEVSVHPPKTAKMYFSLRFPASATASALQALRERPGLEKLEYVDFRVENRVYYK